MNVAFIRSMASEASFDKKSIMILTFSLCCQIKVRAF